MINILFVATLYELFLGGGGRLITFGGIPIRMLLFGLCLLAYALQIQEKKMTISEAKTNAVAISLVLLYLFVHTIGSINGLARGTSVSSVIVEVQQSFFWVIAPFFALQINSQEKVHKISKILVRSGLMLSCFYLSISALIMLNILDYTSVMVYLSNTGDFFFKIPPYFTYKSFIYVGIAALFIFIRKPKRANIMLAIPFIAIALILSRGLILSLTVTILIASLLIKKNNLPTLFFMFFISSLISLYFLNRDPDSTITDLLLLWDKSSSVRIDDMTYMIKNLDLVTFFIGSGFGPLINDRQAIENTYLWAIWRIGFLGFLFWLIPLYSCIRYFIRIPRSSPNYLEGLSYLMGTIFIYINTATNPYLNNPIGLSFVILSVFSLRLLSQLSTSKLQVL